MCNECKPRKAPERPVKLPSDWALKRAIEELDYDLTLYKAKKYPDTWRAVHVLARIIEKYEEPPIDPVLKRAREILDKQYSKVGKASSAALYAKGSFDEHPSVLSVVQALKEPCPE